MAAAKKTRAKPKTKAKTKTKTKTKPKATAKQAKPAAKPKAKPAASAVEREVAEMLRASDDGEIDNVWDIAADLVDLDKRLPKSSPLRPQWNKFVADCEQIMMDYA